MRVYRRRGAGVLVGGVLAAALVTGCGIRTTTVPVDGGAAPSRLPCSVSGEGGGSRTPGPGVSVRVYLMCASGLEAVDRQVPAPDGRGADARVAAARALLGQLRAEPSRSEREAGFTTYVRPPLTVSGSRDGDPAGALRLSRQPEDLPPAALSQIVCTYAENGTTHGTAVTGGTVVLGGPGDYPVRHYQCSAGIRERPESAVPTRSP
ncbi:hypothetical protein [Streptomyces sp. NPDC050856]|uniref:hypothetical protein n=1 Tax=Streptomyces sp. NPDC050856 TaxID=3154939 RepID=UPI0033C988B2